MTKKAKPKKCESCGSFHKQDEIDSRGRDWECMDADRSAAREHPNNPFHLE